jgi:hypothetical protein
MGELVDFEEYRKQREEAQLQQLQEKLQELAEGLHIPPQHGYHTSLEDMLSQNNFFIKDEEDDEEEPPQVEYSTSRWDHFLKMMDALWLAFRHFWRLIWGPTYEIFH